MGACAHLLLICRPLTPISHIMPAVRGQAGCNTPDARRFKSWQRMPRSPTATCPPSPHRIPGFMPLNFEQHARRKLSLNLDTDFAQRPTCIHEAEPMASAESKGTMSQDASIMP